MAQKEKSTAKSGRTTSMAATFRLYAPDAQDVKLAGDFNQWQPQSLRKAKDGNGLWENTLNLETGQYEYKFIVDGEWLIDPQQENHVPNSYGTFNSVIRIGR